MISTHPDWQVLNQNSLAIALEEIRQLLQSYIAQFQEQSKIEPEIVAPRVESEPEESPSALDYLSLAFNLTSFERQILLLCAGVELSASLAQLCATAQRNSQFTYPTFSLALAVFASAQWSALTPVAPLRRWRLIELVNSDSLTQSRLRIDERVLHYLTGVSYLDDRLNGLVHLLPAPQYLSPSHQQLTKRIVQIWMNNGQSSIAPIIHLSGSDRDGTVAIAATVCEIMEIKLYRLSANDLPATAIEREALARLWEREAVLSQSVLCLDCNSISRDSLEKTIIPFIASLRASLIIIGIEPFTIADRPVVHLEVSRSSLAEQRLLWQQALQPLNSELNGQLDGLVSQFNLSATNIQSVCAEVNHQSKFKPEYSLVDQLWDTCRIQTRPHLNDLAQRISSMSTWDDLVLPQREKNMLREIVAQVRQQAKVYDTWGFSAAGTEGLGISALFSGLSGTGKTLAAKVISCELRLDLYRIDLSRLVSKYIGETEKNLSQVFDGAESGGVILLFDEADALFGKRSEVKDAHDRYANIEVSYLLQRIEAYRGLAILTTNSKKSLDSAFMRRLRFMVQFPFPNIEQRRQIWQRMFPPQLPTQELNFDLLARLNIPGGNIRNIALNAAFLAADQDTALQMGHLLAAVKTEYSKLEKTLTDTEIRGWK